MQYNCHKNQGNACGDQVKPYGFCYISIFYQMLHNTIVINQHRFQVLRSEKTVLHGNYKPMIDHSPEPNHNASCYNYHPPTHSTNGLDNIGYIQRNPAAFFNFLNFYTISVHFALLDLQSLYTFLSSYGHFISTHYDCQYIFNVYH